jgi:FkbM family methyltransferase
MNLIRPQSDGFDWSQFKGSKDGLKWMRRDLPNLDRIIGRCQHKRVAVQAGGNLGIYPKRLAASFEAVYTFEVAPELFPLLYANAPEPNIYRYQAALGFDRAMVGTSTIRRDGRPGTHEGITHISGPGKTPTLRLDDFALPICDLICLDVEGWELYALLGAVDTISRCRPVLSVEINHNASYVGVDADELRERIMGEMGYRHVDRLQSDDIFEPVEWLASC